MQLRAQATILRGRARIIMWGLPAMSPAGDRPMRMFESVASTVLVIAAQALVVGVVITTL
jgi:hypothetical protein